MMRLSRIVVSTLGFLCVLALVPGAGVAATTVSVTAQPNPAEVNQTVQFTATAAADPGVTVTEYDWEFGDGRTCVDCGASPSYAYAATGTFTATVTAYDSTVASSSATVTVHVTPVPQETAQAGSVQAELFYHATTGQFGATVIRDESLKIIRQGIVLYDGPLPRLDEMACPPCEPFPVDAGSYHRVRALQVQDLEANGEPDVVLNVSNEGNICCGYTVVYSYRPASSSYAAAVEDWGDWGTDAPPQRDLDHNGVLEWVGGDARFRYAFDCGGCSWYPIQIWRFQSGRFVDVTRSYPRLVARDAAKIYRFYLAHRLGAPAFGGVRGALAAYLADEYSLGRGAAGWRVLNAAARHGYLGRGAPGYSDTPAKYLRKLRTFLRRLRYIR